MVSRKLGKPFVFLGREDSMMPFSYGIEPVSIVVVRHDEMTTKTWFVRIRGIINFKNCVLKMTQIDETR